MIEATPSQSALATAANLADRLAAGLKDLWLWWLDELRAMLPPILRDFGKKRPGTLLICLSPHQVEIVGHDAQGRRNLGRWDWEEPKLPVDENVRSALEKNLLAGKSQVGIQLPYDWCLTRELDLPLAVEADLTHILRHQIERLTPIPASDATFDYRIVERRKDRGMLRVRLTVVPRRILNEVLDRAGTWGIEPAFIDVESPEGGQESAEPLNLLKNREDAQRPVSKLGLSPILLMTNIALAGAIVVMFFAEKDREQKQLSTQVALVKTEAQVAAKLREAIERAETSRQFLPDKRRNTPTAIAVVDELTRLLPDGAWLERLTMDRQEVLLQGNAARASDLIAEIEGSPMFRNVRFRAPVRPIPQSDIERFQISAELLQWETP